VKQSRCRSCSAPIFFAKTRTGKNVPIDWTPRVDGNLPVICVDGLAWILDKDEPDQANADHFVSHFATCPQAKKWRKPKQDRKEETQ